MWEKVVSICFLIFFPILTLCVFDSNSEKSTENKNTYYFILLLQSILVSFFISYWIHLIPCFWLLCNCENQDDLQLRAILWIISWILSFPIVLLVLYKKENYSYLKYVSPEPSTSHKKSHKKSNDGV